MLEQLVTNHVLRYVLVGVVLVGVGMEVLLGIKYSTMIKRTLEIGNSTHSFIEKFKQNFFVSYKFGLNVNNVDKFVDKHVNKQKFMGIYLYIWEKRCGQARVVSGAIAVLSVVLELYYGCGKKQWIENAAWLTVLCTMWISFVMLSNCSGKKKQLHWNLAEYLENVYIPRLQLEKGDPKQFQKLQGDWKIQKRNEERNVQEREVQQKEEQPKVTTQSKRRKEKAAAKKMQSKNSEMERLKKDLAEELKQERIARKQRLKKQKMEKEKSMTEEKKQLETTEGKEKEEKVKQDATLEKAQQETKITEEKSGEKKVELTADGEQLLQDILREYLGEA